MNAFLKNKTPGVICNLVAVCFALLALIGYAAAGRDSYGFVPMVVILLALGIFSALVFSNHDYFEFGPVVTMALFGAGFAVFINSRFMYYSHQFYGIASDPISGAMILTTIGFAGMIVFEIISGFLSWGEKR